MKRKCRERPSRKPKGNEVAFWLQVFVRSYALPRCALERESKSFALALMAAQHWRAWAMYLRNFLLQLGCQLCTKLISCDLRARAKQRQEEELTRQFLEAEKKLKQKEIEEKEYSCVRIST